MEQGAVEGAGFPSAGTDGAGGSGRRPGACRLPGGTFECGAGSGCAGGSLSRHGRRCGGSSRGWRLSVPLFFPGASGGDSVFHPASGCLPPYGHIQPFPLQPPVLFSLLPEGM